MKILLLNPPFMSKFSRQSRSPCVAKGGTIYFPYYLAYACGSLEKSGYTPTLVDAIINEWSHEKTLEFVKSGNFDLIVIDTSTPSIKNDLDFAIRVKKALPESHITLTGTHPTNVPESLFSVKEIDSVCIGEYDNTLVSLASALKLNKTIKNVKGLAFRKGKKVIRTGPTELVSDLDKLPFVSDIYLRHLGKDRIKKYFYASVKWPELQILTARGCPYNCAFCNIPMKRSYRARTVENVIEELKFIEKNLPFINEIMIEDETFHANEKRTIELCDRIIEEKIKLTWSCNARVNVNMKTLIKMKQAGCRLMCVGFESVSQKSLNSITKGTTEDMQRKFMKKANKAKLMVNGCFILGLPTDTPKTMQSTIDFAKDLNPNSAQFYPLMVYPGTTAYNWAKDKGYLETEDWSMWITPEGLHNATISRPGLSSEELINWCNKARLDFYTNPRFVLKMIIQSISDKKEAVRIIKGSKVLFKYLLKYITTKQAKVR